MPTIGHNPHLLSIKSFLYPISTLRQGVNSDFKVHWQMSKRVVDCYTVPINQDPLKQRGQVLKIIGTIILRV